MEAQPFINVSCFLRVFKYFKASKSCNLRAIKALMIFSKILFEGTYELPTPSQFEDEP